MTENLPVLFTMDEMKKAGPVERERYYAWLKEQRKRDRIQSNLIYYNWRKYDWKLLTRRFIHSDIKYRFYITESGDIDEDFYGSPRD